MSNIFKFHRRTNNGSQKDPTYGEFSSFAGSFTWVGKAIGDGGTNVGYYGGDLISSAAINGKTKLIIAPKSTGQAAKEWSNNATKTTLRNVTSVWDGLSNTNALQSYGVGIHPAANHCKAMTTGGYNDWYLPAKLEVEIIYRTFKPTNDLNNTSFGANSYNADPNKRSNYTTTVPAQTTFPLFVTGGAESIEVANLWSSTEYDASNAYGQYTVTGKVFTNDGKFNGNVFRAVRRA